MSKAKTKPKKEEKAQFTIKMENSKILRAIVETLANIIDETEIQISSKEFRIKAMDPSRICLLQLTSSKGNFDEYECSKECKIALNLDDLDKILKRSSVNDSLMLSYEEEEQKIKIKMQKDGSTKARNFSLALLDLEIEEVPMDNLNKIEYNSKWSMDPDLFIEALKDAEIYSEILNIESYEEEGLKLSSLGQIGEMEYKLGIDDLYEADLKENNSGAYSLTFLKSILKIASITETLEVSLETDHPLKMIFRLLEGGILKYYLAPRVLEEEFGDEDLLEDNEGDE